MYIKILLQATGAYCLLYIRRRLILMASKKLDRFEINGVTKEELTLTSYWCVKINPIFNDLPKLTSKFDYRPIE